MNLGTAQIIQGNALNLPLPDSSVDAVITSPPYFGLRSYQDGGQHYDGQIGSEATPAEFLDALLAATREMVRVLKPSGSIFVNLGDKYATGSTPGPQSVNTTLEGGKHRGVSNVVSRKLLDGRPKSLMGMPWRYALQCIDQLGLILRAEIIWAKPNGLPESVTDRVRRSHEQWFHFVVQPRYFAAVDEIREAHSERSLDRYRYSNSDHSGSFLDHAMDGQSGKHRKENPLGNSLGKLPGSVWTIPTQPLTVPPELGVDHFAAYPMEWPRRIIQGWTPNGVCTACGQGRRPTVEKSLRHKQFVTDTHRERMRPGTSLGLSGRADYYSELGSTEATITGYVCACAAPTAPTTPAVVLDPFGGTGTTALIAKALGRTGITIDLSSDYCRLATWRCNDPRELAAALQVEKPETVHPDQLDLFSEAT